MSSAVCATWRIPCSGLQASRTLPLVTLGPASRDLRIAPPLRLSSNISRRPFGSLYHLFRTEYRPTRPSIYPPCRIRTTVPSRTQTTSTSLDPKPKKLRDDNSWEDPFTNTEIKKIFGHTRKISPKLGNRVLALLHSRRLSGTLDINLPAEVTRTVPQSQIDKALEWLRENYPVDEDACIMQRIEREEREDEEKFNYHPQSGSYGAQLGEQNDAYGRSVFQKMREKNEKQYLEEEERKRKAWLEGEGQEYEQMRRLVKGNTKLQKFEEAAVVEARPRADPSVNPYLAWRQRLHIESVPNQVGAVDLTTSQRLLMPLLFSFLTLGLCYVFAQNYEPPQRQDRLWPDVPPALATVGTIVAANIAVTVMWRHIPPSWKLLNRFFVIVPFYPHSVSLIGSMFSHQTFKHLFTNMLVLTFMGTRVHDELGRGNFLAIYLASGVVGSMMSLTNFVLLGQLGMSSLGASAGTSGIVAAWCMFHSNDKVTLWILPREWRDAIWTHGWIFLSGLIAVEVLSMAAPARLLSFYPLSRLLKMDHVAHLGGYLTGAGCGYALSKTHPPRKFVSRALPAT
ncbi:Peptidase S54 rhomboid, partial [Penicillium riverlandense]|uniref:Peptidase S54 rhomboid n=1 Tax=Penicillium riverlandense TaxID=1903569 RepID=UPI0025466264